MARRVGFGDEKKSVAEAHLDKFRARSREKAQAQKPAPRTKRQWIPITFLMFWLAGWTAGMALAFLTVLEDGEFFLWIWLFFAAIGWLSAAVALIKLLKGTPIDD